MVEVKKRTMMDYDKEAKVYDNTRWFYEKGYGGKRERELLYQFIRDYYTILDLACGTGRLLPFLCKKSNLVVGLDISKGMLKVAKRKISEFSNCELIQADAETLPFREEVFDMIVTSRAFKFFPNPLKALTEGERVLKVGGQYAVSLETSDPFWIRLALLFGLPTKAARFEWRYRKKDILSLFKRAGFKIRFVGVIMYFGRSLYELAQKYFLSLLKLLNLIDSRVRAGRNIMVVGEKSG